MLFRGDGYLRGLISWCGERSTGTTGAFKRTAAPCLGLLKWLVTLEDPSGRMEANIFNERFLQVPLEELQQMQLDLHLLPPPGRSAKAASRMGNTSEACELLSLQLQGHKDENGEPEEIAMHEILYSEVSREIFMDWLKKSAMGSGAPRLTARQSLPGSNIEADGARAGTRGRSPSMEHRCADSSGYPLELDPDQLPMAWSEVDKEQFAEVDRGLGPTVQMDSLRPDEPVPDPIGLNAGLDMRLYQEEVANGAGAGAGDAGGDNLGGGAGGRVRKERLKLLQKVQGKMTNITKKKKKNTGGRLKMGRKEALLLGISPEEIDDVGTGDQNGDDDIEDAEMPRRAWRGASHLSVCPTDDNFDPRYFMTVVHGDAGFEDLHKGLRELDQRKESQAAQLQRLVRDNFDKFVRCADFISLYANQMDVAAEVGATARAEKQKEKPLSPVASRRRSIAMIRAELKAELKSEKEERIGTRAQAGPKAQNHLKELTRLVEEAQASAGRSFAELLQKLENIKQVRSAQQLLHEKGAMLDLPAEMRLALKEDRYKDLVTMYGKAQGKFSSPLLQQVQQEAELVSRQACDRLLEVLRSPDVSLEEQTTAMTRLQELRYNGEDPLAFCLDSQTEHFLKSLADIRESFGDLLREPQGEELRAASPHVTVGSPGIGKKGSRTAAADGFMAVGGGASNGFFDGMSDGERSIASIGSPTAEGTDTPGSSPERGRSMMSPTHEESDTSKTQAAHHALCMARLAHVSNLSFCLGSWVPHLAALSSFLVRKELTSLATSGSRNAAASGRISPRRSRRKLFTASGPLDLKALAAAEEAEGGRTLTATEARLQSLFNEWLSSASEQLKRAIFGDESIISEDDPFNASDPDFSEGAQAFCVPLPGALEPHYLEPVFHDLSLMYTNIDDCMKETWEAEQVLSTGMVGLEELVRQTQSAFLRSELDTLAKQAGALVETWEDPQGDDPDETEPRGGTRLVADFAQLAASRLSDLTEVLPRPDCSGEELTAGLEKVVESFLKLVLDLATESYNKDARPQAGHGLTGGALLAANASPESLSADEKALLQAANCLHLRESILPELWQTAVEIFNAEEGQLERDIAAATKVKDTILTGWLKRKSRELKSVIKAGWWGSEPATPIKPLRSAPSYSALGGGPDSDGSRRKTATLIGDDVGGLPDEQEQGRVASRHQSISQSIMAHRHMLASQRLLRSNQPSSRSNKVFMHSEGQARRFSSNAQPESPARRETRPRGPKPLPPYLIKVLLSLVRTRQEARQAFGKLLFRKGGTGPDKKERRDLSYADYVLRESCKQVMDLVCDYANARVGGGGKVGPKPLNRSDRLEQAEKIAQVEFLRDALNRHLPSSVFDRIERCINRIATGKSEGSETSRGDELVSVTLAASMPGKFYTAMDLQDQARVYVVCLK
ncbi:unnamed protein product [Chrysoparadoxa australica]